MKTHLLWCAAVAVCLAPRVHALAADDRSHPASPEILPEPGAGLALQGLFCNTEKQIDDTLSHMSRSLTPRAAVAVTNNPTVVCNFVDLLHYVVDQPVLIGEVRSTVHLFKYEASLVGVVVGSDVRPIAPAVRIFFAIPERLNGVPAQRPA